MFLGVKLQEHIPDVTVGTTRGYGHRRTYEYGAIKDFARIGHPVDTRRWSHMTTRRSYARTTMIEI
jgi:hypothetical protein